MAKRSLAKLDAPTEPRRRRRRLRTAVIAIASLVSLLLVGGAVTVEVISRQVLDDVERIPDVFASIDDSTRPQKQAGTEHSLNLLMVGVDTHEQATEGQGARAPGRDPSDVIMIVHVGADRRSASVVSIPPDSWVTVPGRANNKISSAYATGGPSLLVRTVEQLTALRMDHFAIVDFAGFRDIADAVGGIDVRVPQSPRGAGAEFPAGSHHFDGETALRYIRQPDKAPGGDLRRVRRQQEIMKALMAKAGSVGLLSSPGRALTLVNSVARAIGVDDSLDNGRMRSLALSMRHLRPESVVFLTAPVRSFGLEGRQRVVRLDTARAQRLWTAVKNDDAAGYVSGSSG